MLYLLAIPLISCVQLIACTPSTPGVPIPAAEMISQIFAKHLKVEGSVMNYLKNTKSNDTEVEDYANDNLDISVMDMNNFRRLIDIGRKQTEKNYRRQHYYRHHPTKRNRLQTAGYKTHVRENPDAFARDWTLYIHDRLVEKIFHLMKQSIYVARDRIDRTKKMREFYAENPSYKIALLDSAIQHNLRKMDYLSARIKFTKHKTHFLWILVLFEKILQCNIDINYAVERMFIINRAYNQVIAGMPNMPRGLAADPEAYKHMLGDLDDETKQNMMEDGYPSSDEKTYGQNDPSYLEERKKQQENERLKGKRK